MKILHLNINDLKGKYPLEEWLSQFSLSIQLEVRNYLKEADQWRVLGGKILLRYVIQNMEGTLQLSDLKYGEKGKPYFENSIIEFNLSHSGDVVIIAASQKEVCGIDIELHRPIDHTLLKRKFTEKEWEVIEKADNSNIQFFHYWAMKESIIKADGRGVEVLGKSEIVSNSEAICDGVEWRIYPFALLENYSTCLATKEKIEMLEPEKLTIDEITIA